MKKAIPSTSDLQKIQHLELLDTEPTDLKIKLEGMSVESVISLIQYAVSFDVNCEFDGGDGINCVLKRNKDLESAVLTIFGQGSALAKIYNGYLKGEYHGDTRRKKI